jgi:hypothetical protein
MPPGRVQGDVRRLVLERDGGCVLAFLEAGHVCRDQWGRVHDPHDLARLTVEHVKHEIGMAVRAPSDPAHMVALDFHANLRPPTKAQRGLFRAHLATLA